MFIPINTDAPYLTKRLFPMCRPTYTLTVYLLTSVVVANFLVHVFNLKTLSLFFTDTVQIILHGL